MSGTPLQLHTAPPMEYRHVGRSELVVSAVGFGCWPMGGSQYGPVDERELTAAVHRALSVGITCFDTAPVYGHGHADEVLGRSLGAHRQDVVVVSKVGLVWDPDHPHDTISRDGSAAEVLDGIGGLNSSLKRLQTDYIDLLLVHWPDTGTAFEETMAALMDARQQGKVRYLGVSNFTTDQIMSCLPHAPLVANQVGYHLFDRRWEHHVFPTCRQFGLGVVAYGSLAHGLLTGTMTPDMDFDSLDWRRRRDTFGQDLFSPANLRQNLAVVEQLQQVAQRHRATLPQLALAWVLRHPAVSLALVGFRRPQEVTDGLGALGLQLTAADLDELDTIMSGAAGQVEAPPD